ncbi:MAG: hypothetical protein IIB81_01310 [Nanoarchaeota archaeon]|nr:hypothetical protein [Nanoarchaeota archaeon]
MGKSWSQEGKTVKLALDKFDLTWEQIKGKGTLTVSKDKKEHEHLMTAVLLRRIFSNKVMKDIWSRNLTYLLK